MLTYPLVTGSVKRGADTNKSGYCRGSSGHANYCPSFQASMPLLLGIIIKALERVYVSLTQG